MILNFSPKKFFHIVIESMDISPFLKRLPLFFYKTSLKKLGFYGFFPRMFQSVYATSNWILIIL